MATCADITGLWKSSLIIFDAAAGAEEAVEEDGTIRIFKDAAGALKGEHNKTPSVVIPLTVECKEPGVGRVYLTLTEVNGNTTTVYTGKVVYLPNRDTLIIAKGRVKRTTTGGLNAVAGGDGDWSTEKPT
jgi:hypothetical protein